MSTRGGYAVAQLGARMHYAVPRILEQAGRLERLYTDICGSKGWPRLLNKLPRGMRPNAAARLVGRNPTGIPNEKISTFGTLGLLYALRLMFSHSSEASAATHLWANDLFCRRVLATGLGNASGVYTFNGAGLPLLRWARAHGRSAIMEQTIAPLRLESELMAIERQSFPDWEPISAAGGSTEALCRLEEAEWQAADIILCGSEFVRDGIAKCGGPAGRCRIVPYGVDTARFGDIAREHPQQRRLRVLTVGALGLRKGTPYLLAAAKRLGNRGEFRAVGPIGINIPAHKELRRHIDVTGPVPRSDIMAHFAWADIFLLPSLCEGSATATYEALACGLPVICTPNTGSMVTDGIDGFIVPVRDSEGIAQRIEQLDSDRNLLAAMSAQARQASQIVSEDAYAARLLHALDIEPNP